jgi:hypothetical protein
MEGSIDKDTQRRSSACYVGRRGGLCTPLSLSKAKATARKFRNCFGGPFNETRDSSGFGDCHCYQRPAMAERGNTSDELPGRSQHMARVHQGVYLSQLQRVTRRILPRAREGSKTRHRRTVNGSIDRILMAGGTISYRP